MAQAKKILFFPLNSPGHINSSLGIADRLKNDFGCRTIFLVLGDTMGNSIREHEHELVILNEKDPYQDYEISESDDLSAPPDEQKLKASGKPKDPLTAFIESTPIMETCMVRELTTNHDQLAMAIGELAPDLIIVDAYYIPPCIVKGQVPWVRLYSANPLTIIESCLPDGLRPPFFLGLTLWDKEKRQHMRANEPDKWQAILAEWRAILDKIFSSVSNASGELWKFMQEHQVEPPPIGKQAHDSPHLNIYMYPKALDYDQDDDLFVIPKRWFGCDSLIRQETSNNKVLSETTSEWDQKIAKALGSRDTVVFFSLGSLASGDYFRMKRFVDILRQDQSRLYIVSKGANGHRYELDPNNMIGANYLPQMHVLRRANLAIVHGGNNSITECLYYGVPMIVMPAFADQLDNAQRIEDLRLGKRLCMQKCNKDELLAAVEQVLNDQELVARVRNIGQQMRFRDDPTKVCLMLNKLLADGQISEQFIDECRSKSVDEIRSNLA